MLVEPINDKAFKHYKFYTKQNNMILAFSSYENTNICKTKSEKLVLLDLGITTYKNKKKRCIQKKTIHKKKEIY